MSYECSSDNRSCVSVPADPKKQQYSDGTCNDMCHTYSCDPLSGMCVTNDVTGVFKTTNCDKTCVKTPYACSDAGMCVSQRGIDASRPRFGEPTCGNTCFSTYGCDPVNGQCKQMAGGQYTEKTCGQKCVATPYTCGDDGLTCVPEKGVDPSRPRYANAQCDDKCHKYLCDKVSGKCVRDDVNGTYNTPNCDGKCEAKPYRCSDDHTQCVIADALPRFADATCDNACHRWGCDPLTNMCVLNNSGKYTSSNCDNACGAPTPYACSDQGKCVLQETVQDKTRPRYAAQDCNGACHMYSCDPLSGKCVIDDAAGTHNTPDCGGVCVETPYKCDPAGQCVRANDADPLPRYNTASCDSKCVPPTSTYGWLSGACVPSGSTGVFADAACTLMIPTPQALLTITGAKRVIQALVPYDGSSAASEMRVITEAEVPAYKKIRFIASDVPGQYLIACVLESGTYMLCDVNENDSKVQTTRIPLQWVPATSSSRLLHVRVMNQGTSSIQLYHEIKLPGVLQSVKTVGFYVGNVTNTLQSLPYWNVGSEFNFFFDLPKYECKNGACIPSLTGKPTCDAACTAYSPTFTYNTTCQPAGYTGVYSNPTCSSVVQSLSPIVITDSSGHMWVVNPLRLVNYAEGANTLEYSHADLISSVRQVNPGKPQINPRDWLHSIVPSKTVPGAVHIETGTEFVLTRSNMSIGSITYFLTLETGDLFWGDSSQGALSFFVEPKTPTSFLLKDAVSGNYLAVTNGQLALQPVGMTVSIGDPSCTADCVEWKYACDPATHQCIHDQTKGTTNDPVACAASCKV